MPRRRVPLIAVAVLVTAAACSSPPEGSARIRVDQGGFVTDETKHAHLMSTSGASSFRVLDDSGTPVLEGAPSSTATR